MMTDTNKFTIFPADNHIWNEYELIKFLVQHQNTDIIIKTNSEGCCARAIGLYKLLDLFKFKSVTIQTLNIVEYHDSYVILGQEAGFHFFKVSLTPNECIKFHYWDTSYIFGVLFNRPIWHRIGIASHCHKHHESKTLLNFRSNPHDVESRKFFEMQALFTHAPTESSHYLQHLNGF